MAVIFLKSGLYKYTSCWIVYTWHVYVTDYNIPNELIS